LGGTIVKVDFLENGTLIGTAAQAPFTFTWQGAAVGSYMLSAMATDDAGRTESSADIAFTVTSGGAVGGGGAGWEMIPPAGFGADLSGVFFADLNNGWTVGSGGVILHTQDGGTSWVVQPSNTRNDLSRVQFVSTTRGWVVGAGGTMLSTSDGGQTWTPLALGTTSNLLGLSFVTPALGWVAGGGDSGSVVLKTTDGGVTWSTVVGPDLTGEYEAIFFASATYGWVGGSGVILSTTDGGSTWTRTPMVETMYADPFPFHFHDARFMSESVGMMVGSAHTGGVIVTTYDGGATWNTNRVVADPSKTLSGAAFGDARNVWAVGSNGLIFASADQDATWSPQDSGTFQYLRGVWFVDGLHGWVVGGGGLILRTTTGGRTGS
jgi:photosystem II stability/assembly factor-like uncharacterized protein